MREREIWVNHKNLPMFIHHNDMVSVYDYDDDVYANLKVQGSGIFESGELEGFEWFLAANIDTGEIVRVNIDTGEIVRVVID